MLCLCLIILTSPNLLPDIYYHSVFTLNNENGNATINSIELQTRNLNQTPTRITKIATLITQNFSDSWWPYQWKERFCYYPNDSPTYNWCSPYYGTPLYQVFDTRPCVYTFVVDKQGHAAIWHRNDLSNDPKWIAYQRGGNCQTISILFNETLNRSGFVSRVVKFNGFNHVWTEVNLNGKWKVFDIQKFGEMNNTSNQNSFYWDVDPTVYGMSYTNLTVFSLNLTDDGLGENITDLYFPPN